MMKYLNNLCHYPVFRKFFCTSKCSNKHLLQYANFLNHSIDPYLSKTPFNAETSCNINNRNIDLKNLSYLIRDSTDLILDSLKKFEFRNVYLSFNGGKDSVVAFHLYRLASHQLSLETRKVFKLQAVYFREPNLNEFPEIKEFMELIVKKYDVDFRVIETGWAEGVKKFYNENLSFILGTRSVDDNCRGSKPIEPGSSGDHHFTLINPILDWTYGDIWNFLIFFQLDYCKLYDQGYTSIGSVNDSFPNPHLKQGDGYLPAYKLTNWEYERSTRLKK